MHQPARTLTAASTREWIPIDVAVQRSGLAARTWRDRAVKLASQGLAMQAPPSGGVGKPVWWFDPRCDVRLAAAGEAARARRTTEALSGVYPIHDVRRAERKLHYINTWESACRNAPRGTTREAVAAEIVDDARREEGDTFRISVRSLYAWSRAYKAHGLEGLIDRGRSVATLGRPAKRSDDAVAFFYGLYHTQQKFTVVQCHEATQREAQRKRWSWAPSLSATIDWLRRHDDAGTTLLMRKGHAAWRHAVMPYMEQDYAGVAPGRMYVCDHHQVKYFVQHKGKAIRPWLTAVMDCRTRVLVGYHLGPAPQDRKSVV